MNTNAQQAIGLFDSGIGGLTVANALINQLPNESLIYFGDTAHLPYGDKSADTIRYFTKTIGNFLLSKECKIIVIACNTASSVAYEMLQNLAGDKAHVFSVIEAVVAPVFHKIELAQFEAVIVVLSPTQITALVTDNVGC